MMTLWCERQGKHRGRQMDLVACVGVHCIKRNACQAFNSVPADDLVEASQNLQEHGHKSKDVSMPLFDAAGR